jgi:homoserine kinase
MMVRAYAPASVGNFAVGFDVLGAALAPVDGTRWGDELQAELDPRGGFTLDLLGPYAHGLPAVASDNLVCSAWDVFSRHLRAAGVPVAGCHVTLDKQLPIGSGLGSSASSITAALVAFNALHGSRLDAPTLLRLAGHVEIGASGSLHYDNVAPILLGGLRLVRPGEPVWADALPFPERWLIAVVHPALQVHTRRARQVLPSTVLLSSAVCYAQNLGAFVHALHSGDDELLRAALRDELVEPHRAGLVPGFEQVKSAALQHGALGCSLSGSGPSVFAVCRRERAALVLEAMRSAFEAAGTTSQGRLCTVDPQGARLI